MNIHRIESDYNVKVLYLAKSGSHLYGTADGNSDLDYKGIFLPSKESLLLKQDIQHIKLDTNNSNTANSKDDIDCHLDSFHKWLSLLAKGETNAIDTLFSMWTDSHVYKCPVFVATIKHHYLQLITRNPHSFVGYTISQTKKYNIKGKRYNELCKFINQLRSYMSNFEQHLQYTVLTSRIGAIGFISLMSELLPTYDYIRYVEAPAPRGTEGNWTYLEVLGKKFAPTVALNFLIDKLEQMKNSYGSRVKDGAQIDFKALSHAVRVMLEVEELLTTNRIQFPLKDADYIYKVKKGQIPIEEVQQLLSTKIDEVDYLLEHTDLPEKQDSEFVNELILDIYKDQ